MICNRLDAAQISLCASLDASSPAPSASSSKTFYVRVFAEACQDNAGHKGRGIRRAVSFTLS